MGYSARYHAVTLISVFLALGIGILIGVGFGDAVVSGAQNDLEESLKGDLSDAREARAEARSDLRRQEEFAAAVYPALVDGRLARSRIALVGLGGLSGEISGEVKDGIAPSGGRLTSVSVLGEPLDLDGLEEALEDTGFSSLRGDDSRLERLGRRVGEELGSGGRLIDRLRSRLFDRASGRFRPVDGIVVVREREENPDAEAKRRFDRFERGVLRGLADSGAAIVAVERSDADPSSMDLLQRGRISTVDNIETKAGQLAMVFALAGAEGDFGSGPRADRLLPDLLTQSDDSGR